MQSHEHNVVQTQLNHLYNDVQSVSEKKKRKFLYTEISRGNKIFSFKKVSFQKFEFENSSNIWLLLYANHSILIFSNK